MICKLLRKKFSTVQLPKDTNQALGLAQYAINFMKNGNPSSKV